MASLGDADFRNGNGASLAAQAEGGHAGHVRLEGEHHEVIDGAEVIARHGGGDVAVGAIAVSVGDGGEGRVEPRIGPPRANLGLADGGEVLLHAAFIFRPHLCIEPAHFREVGVQHAAFAAERSPLGCFAAFRFLEE